MIVFCASLNSDRQWAEDSWKWYSDLLNKNDPEKTGIDD